MQFLEGKDILEGAQFNRKEIDSIMKVTDDFKQELLSSRSLDLLKGYVLATLFFEPSTRTRLSFETAMQRLGGTVIGFSGAEATSVVKGESLEDTIQTINQYVDMIAMRHPRIGSAKQAASVSTVPVFNGGDGAGQHPTQALLDIYTIHSEQGDIDGSTIVLCGDLLNGRTIHSGVELYRHYDCKLIFVAPDKLRLPKEIVEQLRTWGCKFEETNDLTNAMKEADILYMTRIQKERFENPEEYEKLKNSYVLTREMIEKANPNLKIMHPLPRVSEINTDVDPLPGAAYFRQVKNGMLVRMALLAMVAGKV